MESLKGRRFGCIRARPGPVVLRPGGYRASGRLDRAGYPAWPLYTLIKALHKAQICDSRLERS